NIPYRNQRLIARVHRRAALARLRANPHLVCVDHQRILAALRVPSSAPLSPNPLSTTTNQPKRRKAVNREQLIAKLIDRKLAQQKSSNGKKARMFCCWFPAQPAGTISAPKR